MVSFTKLQKSFSFGTKINYLLSKEHEKCTRIHHLHLIILFIAKTEDEAPALSDST